MPSETRDTAGVIAPPPLIFVTALAIGFGLEALLPGASLPGALRWPLGGVLVAGGIALALSFERSFRRAHTAVEPWKPTTAIVTSGPYRFTRNPAYLGMTLLSAGIAILAGAVWPLATLLLAVLVIDRGVIAREERYLERSFGEEYLAYKRRVRRWL
jgi:protein-S-isoprenylcysteine O-methyltransferase Ste14